MALSIPVSDSPFFEQSVSLSNIIINIVFKYNTANSSWYLDLLDSQDNPIKMGIKVVSGQNLTWRYSLDSLPEGDLWCIQVNKASKPVGRDNFGQGKDYELYWITDVDMKSLGIDNAVQF